MANYEVLERAAFISPLIDSQSSEDLLDFLKQNGIHDPSFFSIKSGRNSRVWRLENSQCKWILKQYFRHPDDPRDRMYTEFSFLRFLHENGINTVPEPLDCNYKKGLGLYSLLPGKPVKSISKAHVDQWAFD